MLEVDREVGRRSDGVECGRNAPEAKVSVVRAFVRPLVHRMMRWSPKDPGVITVRQAAITKKDSLQATGPYWIKGEGGG